MNCNQMIGVGGGEWGAGEGGEEALVKATLTKPTPSYQLHLTAVRSLIHLAGSRTSLPKDGASVRPPLPY